MSDETKTTEGTAVVETSSTEETKKTDGTEVVTSTTEEAGTSEKKPVDETGQEAKDEGKTEEPSSEEDKEKRYTNEDMKKLRQSLQHETRKEREARIRAEEREKVLREIMGDKKPDPTAKPPEPEVKVELPPRPKRPVPPQEDKFQTRAEYDEAVRKHEQEEIPQYEDSLFEWRRETEQKKQEASQKQEEAKKVENTVKEAITNQVKTGREKYKDFDEVVLNQPDIPITVSMTHVLIRRPDGADVAYYLGKNPEEARRIAALDPMNQAVELGMISAKLKSGPAAPAQQKTTKAPNPPSTVAAKAKVGTDTSFEGKTQEERVALIEKEARERRMRGQ